MTVNLRKSISEMTIEGFDIVTGENDLVDDTTSTIATGLSYIYDVQVTQTASAATMTDGIIAKPKTQTVAANKGYFTAKAAGATGTTSIGWKAFGKL